MTLYLIAHKIFLRTYILHKVVIALREIRKKSVLPIYGIGALWVICALFFPMYKLSHFFILIVLSVVVYLILSKIFPGTVTYEEIPKEPVTTGNAEVDALLKEGDMALAEMRRLRKSIQRPELKEKIDKLIDLTDRIFKDAVDDPADIPQIRRFANYFLPTTIKLLNAYDRMDGQGISGTNISGTLEKINDILDTTIEAYKKQLDSLFENQALDIETDIQVLETMLKREGLTGNDF